MPFKTTLLAGRVDVAEVRTVSLALCLVELPQARIGLVLNGMLVPLLLLHPQLTGRDAVVAHG